MPEPSPPPPGSMCGQRGSGMTVVAVATPPVAGLSNGLHPLTASSPLHADASSGPRTDACVGTCSASTMTEPECLGPCEPGTAVTLEGIVWHETEGGNSFHEITSSSYGPASKCGVVSTISAPKWVEIQRFKDSKIQRFKDSKIQPISADGWFGLVTCKFTSACWGGP